MLADIDVTVSAGKVTGGENMKENISFSGLKADGSGI